MHNLDEYVPWIKVRAPNAGAMGVSQALKILVLACSGGFERGKYMGDVVHVYEMTTTCLQKTKEFVVGGTCSTNMVFTAEDFLLVVGFDSGEVCLIDISADSRVGFVGNSHGYGQPSEEPLYIAAKPGYIVVAYMGPIDDDQDVIRIFKGSHTTWTLQHVVRKIMDTFSFDATGLLAVLVTEYDPFRAVLEFYEPDPWEHQKSMALELDDNAVVESILEHDGEWFVRRKDGSLSVMANAHSSSSSGKYQGTLFFGGFDDDLWLFFHGYGHYAHGSGIFEVLSDHEMSGHKSSLITVYAHPDAIAMASMSELSVAWMAAVVRGTA